MAEALVARGWTPDRILLSSSTRTCETHALMREASSDFDEIPFEVASELYHAGPATLTAIVEEIPEGRTTLVLGHNPGVEMLLEELVGGWHRMSTAACALLVRTEKGWALEEILRPKELAT